MIEILPFRREHYFKITKVSAANGSGEYVPTEEVLKCMERELSFTLLVQGVPLACGGVLKVWEGNYRGWAYITGAAGPYMLHITRAMKKGLKTVAPGRVDITVERDYEPGRRWAEMLGMHVECERLERWGSDGKDHTLYALIQD